MGNSILFITDPFDSLKQEKDTSIFIMKEALRRDFEVFQCEMSDLTLKQKLSSKCSQIINNNVILETAKKNEKELQTPQNFMNFLSFLQDSISSLQKARIPVICAIQGGCIGGGVDLICSADIRLATNDAFFSIRETKIGMVADVGTFPRIVKLLPEGIVKELAFTGRNFSAHEAKEWGFVNRLYDSHEALIEGALEMAKEITSNSPAAVFGCKKVIDFSRDHTIDEGLDWINMWNASMLSQSELMEGFRSYKDKTDGNFAELPKLKDHFSKN